MVGGILLGYLASALWVGDTGGWHYMYGAALPPAVILLAGMVTYLFSSLYFLVAVLMLCVLLGSALFVGLIL